MQSLTHAVAGKRYTMVAADASNDYTDITTGLTFNGVVHVQVFRSGVKIDTDVVITPNQTPGVVRIADGSTYKLTAGDVAHVIAVETP